MPEMVEWYAAKAAEVYTTTPEQFETIVAGPLISDQRRLEKR